MAMRQQDDSIWRSVTLYAVAAFIVLSLLPGCSTFSGAEDEPKLEPTQVEKVAELKLRLQETLAKFQLQKAEFQKLIHSEADLELLIRLMHVKQKKEQSADSQMVEGAVTEKEVTVDYLQMMAANQNALKSDLSRLMQELNALTAASGK